MRKYTFLLTVIMMFSQQILAQGSFYDLNTIQKIEITFTQSNWDYQLDTAKAGSEGYIMASQVKINGIDFDSVGVKYKGNSSYKPSQVKNPLHIELDTYKQQEYQGYTDIKLGNGYKDPSFLREVLSYQIARNYMPAPLSNYANVYINNQLIGLYTNSESIGKKFVNARFGSNTNAFFKCNPIDGAGPGGGGIYPNLVYYGNDSASYFGRYEPESDHGWADLIGLCDTLANHTTDIERVLNVNRALWMLAFDNLLVNLDSYIGGFTQNYYLYKDDNNRFQPVVWDLNESFGTFSETGTGMLINTTQKQQMSHLLHLNDANWPLVKKLLAIPLYKRMYLAHMRTILAEQIASNSYYTSGQALQTLIGPSVSADPNKFFSYSNFTSNLTTDVNIGQGQAPGLTNLMNGRKNYLSALADLTAAQPSITEITVSNSQPAVGSQVNITARISNAIANGAFLSYRGGEFSPFTRLVMADDGLHGDGAAGDGIFGATVPVISGKTEYYLYAENSQAGIFSPLRAEMEVYTLNSAPMTGGNLVINEFMASNTATMPDQDGEYDDWIEIYNLSPATVALDSVYLSDSYNNFLKWQFPSGTVIGPGSYLIVWADEDGSQQGLHANFKLSGSGERIAITHERLGVMDSISFGVQDTDISMQRCPDHSGGFVFAAPSFNAVNNCPTAIAEEQAGIDLLVYPLPAHDRIHIRSAGEPISTLRVVNLTGQTVISEKDIDKTEVDLDLTGLEQGIYILMINEKTGRRIIKI